MPGFNIVADVAGNNVDPYSPNSRQEPSMVHRWRLDFYNLNINNNIQVAYFTAYAKSCARPKIEFDKITIRHQQTEAYLPGRHRCAPIDVSFYAVQSTIPIGPIGNATYAGDELIASELFKLWSKNVLNLESNTLSYVDGVTCDIGILNGLGNLVHIYRLHNVWPQSVGGDQFDYSNNSIATFNVSLVYDAFNELRLADAQNGTTNYI